jgi:hypothetical protein
MNNLFEETNSSGAEISNDGIYRYTLTRQWSNGPCVGWLMFNPSTADARQDDATIRKCVGFSKRWGYGRMVVVNLYAIRSRYPKTVTRMGSAAIGPMNDYWIIQAIKDCGELICAWGCAQYSLEIKSRIDFVLRVDLSEDGATIVPVKCLGLRKDRHPRHPLMLSYETEREEFHV